MLTLKNIKSFWIFFFLIRSLRERLNFPSSACQNLKSGSGQLTTGILGKSSTTKVFHSDISSAFRPDIVFVLTGKVWDVVGQLHRYYSDKLTKKKKLLSKSSAYRCDLSLSWLSVTVIMTNFVNHSG